MPYKIKVTFAEGITEDELALVMQKIGVSQDSAPHGSISHEESIENGQIVFFEEWESKAAYEAFVSDIASSALAQAGISPPDLEEL
ncbi:MAG: hypothetical protein Q9P01_07590 [Anaerolineae bacterium]|nr:hypothetical protein [Anaerolineae bacterium]MDQ7034687.1 hypothetical protein [Anaerolineae bacterium]